MFHLPNTIIFPLELLLLFDEARIIVINSILLFHFLVLLVLHDDLPYVVFDHLLLHLIFRYVFVLELILQLSIKLFLHISMFTLFNEATKFITVPLVVQLLPCLPLDHHSYLLLLQFLSLTLLSQ